jgi:hypothetical protein
MDFNKLKDIKYDVGDFILKYIGLINNEQFADKVYNFIKNKFQPFNYIKQMKPKYIKQYLIRNKENSLSLLSKCENLSAKDKQEIISLLIK